MRLLFLFILSLKQSHKLETLLAIPTVIDGGNHTRSFAEAAATTKAHYACLDVSKALAATGVRVLIDDKFFAEVWDISRPFFF